VDKRQDLYETILIHNGDRKINQYKIPNKKLFVMGAASFILQKNKVVVKSK